MNCCVTAIRFLGGTDGCPFPYGRGVVDAINRTPGQMPEGDELCGVFSSRDIAIEHLKLHIFDPGFWRKSPYLNQEPLSRHSANSIDAEVTTVTWYST